MPTDMPATAVRPFRNTVWQRAASDPAFALALIEEQEAEIVALRRALGRVLAEEDLWEGARDYIREALEV